MKRRLLYFTFAFLFLMSVVPFSAFVPEVLAEENVVCVGGVVMEKGDYLPVGATETQESMPDEGYAFYNGSELILNDYSYTGDGFYCEEKYDKYTTIIYPTVIYSKNSLSLVINGDCSLIGKHASYTTRAICSDGDIEIYGNGRCYLKAKRPIYAVGEITVDDVFLDIYSQYSYGIHSGTSSIYAYGASIRMRGIRGMHTYINGSNISFSGCDVDISVSEMGLFSSGNIIIDDSHVKIVSDNTEFPESYCAIYTNGGEIIYSSVEGKGSFSASGNNSVSFDKEESAGYDWVEFSRTKKLSYIDIADILAPESNSTPDFKGKADSPYTEIIGIEWLWLKENDEVYYLKTNDTLIEGEKYRLKVTVKAGNSYEFDDISTSAYIGNDLVTNYTKDLNLKIRVLEKDYIATNNNETHTVDIGNITLKDGNYLVKGASTVTNIKPDDNYVYYKNGVLYFVNFIDRNADIIFNEGFLIIDITGKNTVSSISDSFEKDEDTHELYIDGEGSLDVIGSNSKLARPNGINLNGWLAIIGGTIYIDADIYCCMDVEGLQMNGGELYCNTAQAGVFAGETKVYVFGGEFHAFDGGGWWQFINDEVTISKGVVYVSGDGKNKIETATEWDGETPLKTYDSVWILPQKINPSPDTENKYLLGDVNNDGVIDSTDYLRIKGHFLGTYTLEGAAFVAGDVNKDGAVDSTDYLRIKGHFLGTYTIEG